MKYGKVYYRTYTRQCNGYSLMWEWDPSYKIWTVFLLSPNEECLTTAHAANKHMLKFEIDDVIRYAESLKAKHGRVCYDDIC